MDNEHHLLVGQPYPHTITDGAVFWQPKNNLLLVSTTAEPLTPDRAWFTRVGQLLVATLSLDGSDSITFVAPPWAETELPPWAEEGWNPGGDHRLLFTLVHVIDGSSIIHAMRTFTISPHATTMLHKQAVVAWERPMTSDEGLAAVHSLWAAHTPTSLRKSAFASCRLGS